MEKVPSFRILPLVQPTAERIPIDINKIKELCAAGLSECPDEDRAIAWLILFNVYPKVSNDWNDYQEKIIKDYRVLVNDVCHLENWENVRLRPNCQKSEYNVQNQELMHLIHGDILRSGRHICFFPNAIPMDNLSPDNSLAPFSEHMRRLERILYVLGECNAFSYMQGFNELICPIYFTLCKAKALFGDDMFEVEALTLQCLQYLLTATPLIEFYTTQDDSSILLHDLNQFTIVFEKHLPNEAKIMKKLDLHPLHYCYRWLNLLFGQEHELPELLIVWDSLLSHIDDIVNFSFYVAIARIKVLSPRLNPNDVAETLQVFQNREIPNIYVVLRDANNMYIQEKQGKTLTKRNVFRRRSSPYN